MVYKSRWTPEEKVRIVLESLNTNISIAELCRKYGVRPPSFYSWREKFFQGGKLRPLGAAPGTPSRRWRRRTSASRS